MPHDCTHDHGHNHGAPEKKADCWTNSSALTGLLADLASVFFSTMRIFYTSAGIDESSGFSASYWALGISVAMAGFCASGSTYCHRTLNTLHQCDETDATPITVVTNTARETQTVETTLLPNNNQQTTLNWLQKILLLGDFLGHACEKSTPLLAVILLFHLSQLEKRLATAACLIIGVFGSYANVRTCYRALKKQNAAKGECDDHGHANLPRTDSQTSMQKTTTE